MPSFPADLMKWLMAENSHWFQLNIAHHDTVDLMEVNELNYNLHVWMLWNHIQRITPTPMLPSKMAMKDLIGEVLTIKRMMYKVGIDK